MEKTFSAEKCRNSIKALEDAMFVIGGKWTLRVIIALKEGHTRFNDLQRTIDGISAKVLSALVLWGEMHREKVIRGEEELV